MGKTVWVNDKYKDFAYYLLYHDPILSLFSNFKKVHCNEMLIILLFIVNFASILATLTASIGFNQIDHKQENNESSYNNYKNSKSFNHENSSQSRQFTLNQIWWMIICALLNGLIICIFTLKWRQFERKQNRKLSTVIMNQNGLTLLMFTLCAMSWGYYYIINETDFYFWFGTIYVLQFLFGWIFEIFILYLSFIVGWKYDHKMMELIPNYLNDGSFSHCSQQKCVYYITYVDYQEFIQYKNKINIINLESNKIKYNDEYDSEMDGEHCHLLNSTTKQTTNNKNNNNNNNWLA